MSGKTLVDLCPCSFVCWTPSDPYVALAGPEDVYGKVQHPPDNRYVVRFYCPCNKDYATQCEAKKCMAMHPNTANKRVRFDIWCEKVEEPHTQFMVPKNGYLCQPVRSPIPVPTAPPTATAATAAPPAEAAPTTAAPAAETITIPVTQYTQMSNMLNQLAHITQTGKDAARAAVINAQVHQQAYDRLHNQPQAGTASTRQTGVGGSVTDRRTQMIPPNVTANRFTARRPA